jgi:nucleoid DNA-binding protein
MAKKAAKSAKAPSKSQVIGDIAEKTGLGKKDVSAVLEALTAQIKKSLGKGGPGVFAIPGLVKINKKHVPARPAQPNWTNPFTGEVQTRPAKEASTKVQVRALKSLKDMV